MKTQEISERINEAIHKVFNARQYVKDDLRIEKKWNHGMGLLPLLSFSPKNQFVLVNEALFTKRDYDRLIQLFEAVGGEIWDFELRYVYYGYPMYYNHGFNCKDLKVTKYSVIQKSEQA